jgi:hypothetical protein
MIVMFFSEMFFLNEGEHFYFLHHFSSFARVIDFFLVFILFYMLCTLWLLVPIYVFKVRSIWALFLAGALLGWAIEGIMPIMYAELPMAVLWPAGSWHILVNVLLGWYFLREVLERNDPKTTVIIFVLMGLFWGVWGTWFWSGNGVADTAGSDYPPEISENIPIIPIRPVDFALLTFTMTGLLVLGYAIVDRFGGRSFSPSKTEIVAGLTLSLLLLFALSGVFSILFLLLVGSVMCVLNENRKVETRPDIFSTFSPGIKPGNLLCVFSMPLAANLVYPVLYSANLSLGLSGLYAFVLLPVIVVSAIMFIVSVFCVFRNGGAS